MFDVLENPKKPLLVLVRELLHDFLSKLPVLPSLLEKEAFEMSIEVAHV